MLIDWKNREYLEFSGKFNKGFPGKMISYFYANPEISFAQ